MEHYRMKILLFLFFFAATIIPQKNSTKEMIPITVGFSNYLISQVDAKDATVAIQMWGDELFGNLGLNYFPEIKIYNDNEEFFTAIDNDKIDLVSFLTTEYFEIANKEKIEPYLVPVVNGNTGYEFILVVKKDKGIKSLTDLKNKKLNIQLEAYTTLIKMWIETSLNENGYSSDDYFSGIKEVVKPSQALFPVFFNQADACIITAKSYELMIELNPQLKNDLIIIQKSPMLVSGIMFIKKNLGDDLKNIIANAAHRLSNSTSGKQILSLFGSEALVKFKPEYLISTKELIDKFEEIENN